MIIWLICNLQHKSNGCKYYLFSVVFCVIQLQINLIFHGNFSEILVSGYFFNLFVVLISIFMLCHPIFEARFLWKSFLPECKGGKCIRLFSSEDSLSFLRLLCSEDASTHGVLWLISEESLCLLSWLHEGFSRLLLRLLNLSLIFCLKSSSTGFSLCLSSSSNESPCRFDACKESPMGGFLRRLRAEANDLAHIILNYYGGGI